MTEGEAIRQQKKSWRVISYELEDRLAELKRVRDDPNLGMRHEVPLMADLLEMVAEMQRQLVLQTNIFDDLP